MRPAISTSRPATYDLEVCATGTDTCPLDLDPVTVEDGTSYSAFAVGSLTGGTLTAVLAVDAIAATAAAPTAPATDVSIRRHPGPARSRPWPSSRSPPWQ